VKPPFVRACLPGLVARVIERAMHAYGGLLKRPNHRTGRSPKDVLDECIRSHRSAAGARPLRVLFRLALPPGAQCFRGSFTEQLTILAGKPAKVHEPPAARNHRYRDRVRRASGEFCVHMV
jgi:hypothetical protein